MDAKHDILATLSYFDIFDYPLTQTETAQFLQNSYSNLEIAHALYELAATSWIFKFDDFYTLQDNRSLIARRRKGNTRARKMLETAGRIAPFLARFPFVRGVAVSGSLSKNFADEKSDIDFFIITSANRLWLARTFMHCFKKLTFLFGKQDLFCMNYYVDEDRLQIKEQNIYTATEIATLLPMQGIDAFNRFYAANKWSMDFLPNASMRVSYIDEMKNPLFKRFAEFILDNPAGDLLDRLLMKYTAHRWAQKTKKRKLNRNGVVMSMDASRHYAKPRPENFQQELILRYEQKIFALLGRYEGKLTSTKPI
ncbi:MAG TPA: nucleotidyltransferase domain-containing protein [Chitinophagaceae bacterium]|nr:nucleotidyltransferase domain-containing protein [Chitinophagaceae bacterium]